MLELPFTIFGVPPARQYRIGCQFYLCRARLIQDKAQKQTYALSPARKLHKCILQKIMSLMMNATSLLTSSFALGNLNIFPFGIVANTVGNIRAGFEGGVNFFSPQAIISGGCND